MKTSDNIGFACTCQETDTKSQNPAAPPGSAPSVVTAIGQTACLYQPLQASTALFVILKEMPFSFTAT